MFRTSSHSLLVHFVRFTRLGRRGHDFICLAVVRCPRYVDVLGSGGIAPLFKTLEVDGFIPRPAEGPDTNWAGRAGLDVVEKGKILALAGNGSPVIQPVNLRCTD